MNTTAHTTNNDADLKTLRSDVAKLRGDLSKIGDTLQDLVQHRGADVVDRVQEFGGKMRDEAKKRVQSVTDEIEERPVASAFVAFGAGVVLGMLFGRR
jgi:ElaB/YqjD/DUF883 family membrane-anchored ribosome-binding protein